MITLLLGLPLPELIALAAKYGGPAMSIVLSLWLHQTNKEKKFWRDKFLEVEEERSEEAQNNLEVLKRLLDQFRQ